MFGKRGLSELKAAVYLYAIEQCSGKREAARKMNVSIDTLSKYIDILEKECGSELLCTVGNSSQLTSHGKKITSYISGIEQVLQHMYAVVSEKDELEGDIHLLWNRSIRSSIISSDLWNFLKRHKQLTVNSISVDSGANVDDYDCDIAFVGCLPKSDNWEIAYSRKIRFGFFATSRYLKKNGYPVDIDDMLQNHHLIFKRDTIDWLKDGDDLVKKVKHKAYISDASFMVRDGVENDVGIGLLPLSFVRYGLVCLDNIKCETTTNAYILVKKDKQNTRKTKLVCEYLKEILKTA